MRFEPQPEPAFFDKEVRQKGVRFIAKHPDAVKFANYWSQSVACADAVRNAFGSLCAYSCLRSHAGDVDHFRSQNECRSDGALHIIYEWSNYRFADKTVNQVKNAVKYTEILDPFEVENDWFSIDLPSLLLKMSSSINHSDVRTRGETSIEKLGLNGDYLKRRRRSIYDVFKQGKANLQYVQDEYPLLHPSLLRRLQKTSIADNDVCRRRLLAGVATLAEIEYYAPSLHQQALNLITMTEQQFLSVPHL